MKDEQSGKDLYIESVFCTSWFYEYELVLRVVAALLFLESESVRIYALRPLKVSIRSPHPILSNERS